MGCGASRGNAALRGPGPVALAGAPPANASDAQQREVTADIHKAAAQKVNVKQDKRAAAADKLSKRRKRKRYKVDSSKGLNVEASDDQWKRAGGPQLEEMVQNMNLIDLRYVVPLIEAGGVMPRWQDLPKSARITARNVWRLNTMVIGCLAVLVLSYPWRVWPRESNIPSFDTIHRSPPNARSAHS